MSWAGPPSPALCQKPHGEGVCSLCWPGGMGRSSPRHWRAAGPLCPPLCSCDRGGCRWHPGEGTKELRCFSHCEPRVLSSAVRSPLVPGERVCPSVHVQMGPLEVWGDCLLFSRRGRGETSGVSCNLTLRNQISSAFLSSAGHGGEGCYQTGVGLDRRPPQRTLLPIKP